MKKLFLIFTMLIFISACSATSKLNSEEKIIYELIIGVIEDFNNPSSVRIASAYLCSSEICDEKTAWINVMAKNGFGASIKTCYYIKENGTIFESDSCFPNQDNIDVSKVNNAIMEYVNDKGWN